MDVVRQLKVLNVCSLLLVAYFSSEMLKPTGYHKLNGGLFVFKTREPVLSSRYCQSLQLQLSVSAFLAAAAAVTFLGTGLVLLKKPSTYHTWLSLVVRVLFECVVILGLHKWNYKIYFEKPSKKSVDEVQKDMLFKVLDKHKDTEYGKDMDLASIKTVHDYIHKVPLNTYWSMEKYMSRAHQGERDVTFRGGVEYLAKTSGTTGKNKAYPINGAVVSTYLRPMLCLLYTSRKHFPR